VNSVAVQQDTLFGFAMQTMRATARTVFILFHAPGLRAPVFAGEIVALLTLGTEQGDQNAIAFFCHGN